MKKIKILRIIARLNIGGPAIHTILLTEGIDKNKFDSILISGIVNKQEKDMKYLANERLVSPLIIPELGQRISIRKDLISFIKLYRLIRKEKPYIVHTHTAKAGTLGRIAAILARTPIKIHTFHGHVLHSYFGKFKTRVFILIERILAHFTDKIIVVSQKIKEELLNLKIGSPAKILVINLGLDIDSLLTIPISSKTELKVGIVGRFVYIKNQRMFLDVAKNVLSAKGFNHNNLKFIVVGDGELKSDLKNYTKKLTIEDKVIFTGWEKDAEKIFADLDIVVLTSLNEGMPVSLIEAMAAAKPVVATDVGGVRDLLGITQHRVVDGDSSFDITERGILVKSKDVQGFSGALRFLLQNPDIQHKMGQMGREFVKERFHKKRLVHDIENLYNEFLEK